MLDTILLVIAAICFGLAALGFKMSRLDLIAAGLLAWVLASLLP